MALAASLVTVAVKLPLPEKFMALPVSVARALFDQVPPTLTVPAVAVIGPLLLPLDRLTRPPLVAVTAPLLLQLPSSHTVPPWAVIGPLLVPLVVRPSVPPLWAVKVPVLLHVPGCTYR